MDRFKVEANIPCRELRSSRQNYPNGQRRAKIYHRQVQSNGWTMPTQGAVKSKIIGEIEHGEI